MKVYPNGVNGKKCTIPSLAILIFLLGVAIRLYVCQYTYIVNPDGILYIHQARAIYYGQWGSLTSCGLSFLSNYPLLIAAAYPVFHNWVVAASAVSLLFGSFTLIPLFFLLKRFFDDRISTLGTLIFALIPFFVSRSVDVVRGPVYWFFLVLGLYFLVVHIDKGKRLYLILCSISFLMAVWARIEAVLFIIVSCFYLLVIEKEKKIKKLIFFILPILIVVIFSISGVTILGVSLNAFQRVNEIPSKFTGPLASYQQLRSEMAELSAENRHSMLQRFLYEARRNIWIIAFGTLLNRALEAFFYPFFLVFAIGLAGIWDRIKSDCRVLLFTLFSISGLVLIYAHIVQIWWVDYRFMAIVILPCSIFVGFGLEKIIRLLRSRFGLREPLAFAVVCLLILISALPKNLKPREHTGLIFRQISGAIVRRAGNARVIVMATSSFTTTYISFYANLDYPGAPCPQLSDGLTGVVGNNYDQFVRNLKGRGVKYFLWEEKNWLSKRFNFIDVQRAEDFLELGRWSRPDTGRLILFEVI